VKSSCHRGTYEEAEVKPIEISTKEVVAPVKVVETDTKASQAQIQENWKAAEPLLNTAVKTDRRPAF
jgi:hypothetical protein